MLRITSSTSLSISQQHLLWFTCEKNLHLAIAFTSWHALYFCFLYTKPHTQLQTHSTQIKRTVRPLTANHSLALLRVSWGGLTERLASLKQTSFCNDWAMQSALPIKNKQTVKLRHISAHRAPFQALEAHEASTTKRGRDRWRHPCLSSALVASWLWRRLIGNTLVYSRSGWREVVLGGKRQCCSRQRKTSNG